MCFNMRIKIEHAEANNLFAKDGLENLNYKRLFAKLIKEENVLDYNKSHCYWKVNFPNARSVEKSGKFYFHIPAIDSMSFSIKFLNERHVVYTSK